MRKTIKRTGFIAVSAVALTSVGVAFAYWTSEGQGTGTGAIGDTTAETVEITAAQTDENAELFPGGPAVPVTLTVDNANSYSVSLDDQQITLTKVTCGTSTTDRKAWFTVDPASTQSPDLVTDPAPAAPLTGANDIINSDDVVAPYSEGTVLAYDPSMPSVAVAMVDLGNVDQNECKDVGIDYEFAVAPVAPVAP